MAARREAAGEPRRQTAEGEMNAAVRPGGVWQKTPGQPEGAKRAEPSNPYSPGKSDHLLENTPVEAAQYKLSRNEQAHPPRRTGEARNSDPLSGPSFLGLADNTAQSPSYLLEDEEPTGGRRRIFAFLLVVILAVGSFLVWRWKQTGNIYPWEAGRSEDHSSAVKVSPSAPQGAPLGAQTQTTPIEANNPSAGNAQSKPAAADTKPATPPPVAAAPDQVPNPPSNEGDAHTVQNDDAGKAIQEPSKAAPPSNVSSAPAPSNATSQPPAKSASTGNAAVPAPLPAEVPAVSAKKPVESARESATNKVSKASLPTPAPDKTREARDKDKGDPLFIQGQRYLYGTGVRQNCDLAQKSLVTAAQNSNVQAQSTLATMFATGHCAPRSLPLAYRWFAKASHQEPNNPRIEKNLEILWKQMTPEEKQAAIQNR
jgi:hypothetical protein